jgi:hypothetical protein
MLTENKSPAWKTSKKVNVTRLTGYIIAQGGIRITGHGGRHLADDYFDQLADLRIPTFLRRHGGNSIEDLYTESVELGIIPAMPDQYPDPADYLLDLINMERGTRGYFSEPDTGVVKEQDESTASFTTDDQDFLPGDGEDQ